MIIFIILALAIIFLCAKGKNKSKGTSYAHSRPQSSNNAFQPPEYVLRDKGEDILAHAPAPVAGLGFTNFPEYIVVGKKRTTNRKNTRKIRACSEAAARAYAIEIEDLMEPLEVSIAPFSPADTNLEYGLSIPAGASEWDAWLFQQSCEAKDTTHIPPAFMEHITARGVPMSWLCGRNYAAEKLFKFCNEPEKAALYVYAVHCSMCRCTPGNILQSQHFAVYEEFFSSIKYDDKVIESILKRPGSDMWKPSVNTNAYRAAVDFLEKFLFSPDVDQLVSDATEQSGTTGKNSSITSSATGPEKELTKNVQVIIDIDPR